MRTRRFMAGLMALGVGVLSSCADPLVPPGAPSMVGLITRVVRGPASTMTAGSLQVHVKEKPEEECVIVFSIDSETSVADSRTGRVERAEPAVLVEGATVAVWYDLVLESCPGQSHAQAIERRR